MALERSVRYSYTHYMLQLYGTMLVSSQDKR